MTTTVLDVPYLSPTQISSLLACEQRYAFKYLGGLREPSSEATATGAGFATALETGDLQAGLDEYNQNRPPVDPVWDDEDVRENERLVAESTIIAAFHAYRERFGEVDKLDKLEREVTYLTKAGPAFILARLDGVGDSALVEDKLRSGSSLRPEEIQLEMTNSHQLTTEIYVCWKRTGELLPINFRLLRKPNRTKTKALKLDKDAIDLLIHEHFAGETAIDVREVTRTLDDMHRFQAELTHLWYRRQELEQGARPVRNPSSCFSFGRTCPFATQCQEAGENAVSRYLSSQVTS